MVWFAWLIAIGGFAGGSWIIYRKFVAPQQSMWEGIGDWFSSKNPLKAEQRKEGKVDKTRADLLQELQAAHEEKTQLNIIINLLQKESLTIEELNTLNGVLANGHRILFNQFEMISNASKNMNTAAKLIDKESKKVKTASEGTRRDWQRETALIREIFDAIEKIKGVLKQSLEDISYLRKNVEKTLQETQAKKQDTATIPEKGKIEEIVTRLTNAEKLIEEILPGISQKVEEVKQVLDQEKIDLSTANVTEEPQQKA